MIALHGRSSAKLILAAHLDSFFSVWEVAQMSQRGENINLVCYLYLAKLLLQICRDLVITTPPNPHSSQCLKSNLIFWIFRLLSILYLVNMPTFIVKVPPEIGKTGK